jgi:hypothetical protein
MRHTFISVGLTNGVKIKWLAEYCGTSVAMIEKHYGKYLGGDTDEQLERFTRKTETLGETVEGRRGTAGSQGTENIRKKVGGPTWIRTRTRRKRAPVSKPERFLRFFAEEELAA